MAAFESLRPRTDPSFRNPDEDPESAAFSPLLPSGRTVREQQRVNTPVVSNMGETDRNDSVFGIPEPKIEPSPDSHIKPAALQNQGVNWEDDSNLRSPDLVIGAARTGFYNVDYDPEGKVSRKNGLGREYVLAANVFGRQFSRDALMKDSEGQRLLHLMEVQRTGAHRDEGFWSGFATFKDTSGSYKRAWADIPFLGWMVDGGFTVSETIDVSQAMRKMQNGEKVSNHEALAVRRYMLQSELDGERGIGYKAGEVFHSSIPFMVEMAAAGALTAKAIGIGTAVGGLPGAVIGAVGGLVFGGVGVAWKFLAKRGLKAGARKGLEAATKATLAKVAAAQIGKDAISIGERNAVRRFVMRANPTKEAAKAAFTEAKNAGRRAVWKRLGEEAAVERFGEAQAKGMSEEGIIKLGQTMAKGLKGNEFARQASFEANKALAEAYSKVADPEMSAKAARVFLVGGDQERQFHYGLTEALEAALENKATGGAKPGQVMSSYWKRKGMLRDAVKAGKGLTDEEAEQVVKGYIEGTLKSGVGAEKPVLGEAAKAVVESMQRSLDGVAVSHGYAREVLDHLGRTTLDSFRLKYGAKTAKELAVNDMRRFSRFLADGVLDGAFRWDRSAFGGLGTIARDGAALHGKMNVLKEAVKVAAVEAPVRGALQMAVGAPLWPVASVLSGHGPTDFVLKGQLGIQAAALQTGDTSLMDNARAIALGAGLVEYISENAGRGFNMFASGIVKPAVTSVLPEPAKELGSALAKKVNAIFGSDAVMRKESFSAIASKIEKRLGAEAAKRKITGSATRDEILNFVSTKKASPAIEAMARQLGIRPKTLLSDAVAEVVTDGKARVAALGMFSYEMMRRGWTPQKFVSVLQRVGYDGILSEMAEERYGGFLQGIFGLNERPSDEGFRGRLAAAWEGLFPDKEQLAVEAIGFAIPSIAHLSLSHVQSRLAQGQLARIRQASQAVNIVRGGLPEVSVSGVSAQYVAARREHQAEVDEKTRERFGTEESNRAKVTEASKAAFSRIRSAATLGADHAAWDERRKAALAEVEARFAGVEPVAGEGGIETVPGKVAAVAAVNRRFAETEPGRTGVPEKTKDNQHLFELQNEDEFVIEAESVVDAIVSQSGTEEELEANLKRYAAESLFGKDGVEAIRNLKRRDAAFSDRAKREFLDTPEMKALLARTPKSADYVVPMDVDDVVNRVEMTVPIRSEDQSPLAGTVAGKRTPEAIRANQHSQELRGELCRSLSVLADAAYRLKNGRPGLAPDASFGQRVAYAGLGMLSRLAGVLDAVVTGDLSLAARNPVQWLLADEALDKNLAGTLVRMKEQSVRIGMARVLAEERELLNGLNDELRGLAEPILREIDAAEAARSAAYAASDPIQMRGAERAASEAREKLDDILRGYTRTFDLLRHEDEIGTATLSRFEAAGEESFQRMLDDYAAKFLTARNVLAVSQSDLSEAALSVVAKRNASTVGTEAGYRYVRPDGTEAVTNDFLSREFRDAHAADIEAARHEIVDRLVDIATRDAIRVNTNARMSVTDATAAVIDFRRAMTVFNRETPADQRDRLSEVLSAIKAMPAFSSSRTVIDLSFGAFTESALGALGGTVDMSEILNMQEDEEGNLSEGDVMKIMRFRGRNFVYSTPEQNQRDARRFRRQLLILANNTVPYVHFDANGDRADVTYSRSTDEKTGAVSRIATVWGRDEAGRPVAVQTFAAPDMTGLVRQLAQAGIEARLRKVVLADDFSLASRDATSVLLFRFGSRENAREFFVARGVDNDHMPPLCRRVYDKDTREEEWEYPSEEDAAERMRTEMEIASSRTPEGVAGYDETASVVYGSDLEDGSHVLGYEEVARDYLRSIGLSPVVDAVEENLVVGSGEKWVLRPNSMTRGDTMFLTSDYNSSGDSEAMLRAVLESSILNRSIEEHHAGRSGFNDVIGDICREFDVAADGLVTELNPLKPEWASRIRSLQESLNEHGQVNPRKAAAIAAAAICFTSERGLGDRGNGFHFSPELAAVVDLVRGSGHFTTFISAVDEALGGVGLFSEFSGLVGAKVQELIQAFSPTGAAVAAARRTAVFNRTGAEGAEKPSVFISKMTYGGTAAGKDGASAFARFEVENYDSLDSVRPDTVLSGVANAAYAFAERFREDTGRPLTLDEAVRITRAAVGGGEAAPTLRPEVRRAARPPRAPSFGGGRSVRDASPEGLRGRSDEIISQVAAAKVARGLAFLIPESGAMVRALGGKLADIEANVVAGFDPETGEPSDFYRAVELFLRSRGVDEKNRAVILENLAIGIGEPLENADSDEADDDTEDEEDAQEEGRLHAFQDQKKSESAVKNKDLQELGSILQYLYPTELRDHTRLFYRMAVEIDGLSGWLREMAESEDAPAWIRDAASDADITSALDRLGRALNVFRSAEGGTPEERIAAAFDWGDETATDTLLLEGVVALNAAGRPDLALAVNMLRDLGRGKKGRIRRAKALSDIAFMSPLDAEVTRVGFGEGGVEVSSYRAGTGSAGAEPVMRAALSGFVWSDTVRGDLLGGLQSFKDLLIQRYDEDPGIEATVIPPKADKDAITVPPGTDEHIASIAGWLSSEEGYAAGSGIPLDVHAHIVAFAADFAAKLRDVSDALVGWTGSHNELATMLCTPGLAGSIVRSMEHTIMLGQTRGTAPHTVFNTLRNGVFYMYGQTEPSVTSYVNKRTGETVYSLHVCPLLETLVLAPAYAVVKVPEDLVDTPEKFESYLDQDTGLLHSLARVNTLSSVITKSGILRHEVFQEFAVSASRGTSAISTVARWYADAAPRRTAQADVRTNDQYRESGRAVQTPSTAPIVEYRLAQNLFSRVKYGEGTWLDSYLANGRRFDDGTYATVVTPGVEIGGRLAEGSAVARYVFEANVGRFTQDRDFRNVRFQLYHGEKPTVYSQQLPGEMVAQIWKDIVSGVSYTLNRYVTKDFRTARLRTMPADLGKIETEQDLRFAYDLLFSVVADHAGCGQIDPKRTQVLMSQGVMYSGHRDRMTELDAEGDLVETDLTVQTNAKGEKVIPATHVVLSLSAESDTSDLGMYLVNGQLVEAQRATATNPDAESFKNHLNMVESVFLTKGQGHDFDLGIYEEDGVPVNGRHAKAQALMRRRVERVLGLDQGILELPTDAQKQDAEYMAKREEAVKAVEFFRKHSTVVLTDCETQKVGLFAARNGVALEPDGSFELGGIRFRFSGSALSYEKDGEWAGIAGVPLGSVKKGSGALPLAVALSAYAVASGKSELDAETCASLQAKWMTPSGVVEKTLAESGLVAAGDMIDVLHAEDGGWQIGFASRHIVGQVMANNDASSRMGHHSPAATNYDRDQAAVQGKRDHTGELSVTRILTVARAVPAAMLRSDRDLADLFLESDEQLSVRLADHPWDDTVRVQKDRKINAFRAKAMRVYPTAAHGVLLGSGIKADIDRKTHKVVRYWYSDGVTPYDIDAVRDARILTSRVAEAYGLDRTVPSGLVNVTGDNSFRYGWHLNDQAFSTASAEIAAFLASVEGAGAKLAEYRDVLVRAHGEGAEDIEAASTIAALVWAVHNGSAEQKKAGMLLCGKMFTDYTGRFLADRLDEAALSEISFHDLFVNNDGTRSGTDFDFTAIEFGEKGRKVSKEEGSPKTIYLGGALFSGDRRPSGNLEAASGLSRAQAPVRFDRRTGVPSSRAQYVLSPVLNAVQGSDTDGDSATIIRFSATGATQRARDAVNAVFTYIDEVRRSRAGASRSGKMTDDEAKGVVDVLRNRFPEFVEQIPVYRDGAPVLDGSGKIRTRLELSDGFRKALGDLLFEVQVNNYRRTPAVDRSAEAVPGPVLADTDDGILDIGFSGRDPVGTDAVADAPVDDGATRAIYKRIVGREMKPGLTYAKAFKECIDALTKGRVPEFELLDAETAAYLSGEAADGSDGRATGVSLQASFGHVLTFVKDDPAMRTLYPHLFSTDGTGHDLCDDLIAHFDKISNALFDVVKDLFAPRAGWRRSMLNYLFAKVLRDADSYADSYIAVENERMLDDAWFFKELVGFALDFHSSETSIPGLLRRTHADNNFLDRDSFGAPAKEDGTRPSERTFRGLFRDALFGEESEGTLVRLLASAVLAPTNEKTVSYLELAEDLFAEASGEFVDDADAFIAMLLGAAKTPDNLMSVAAALNRAPAALRGTVNGDPEAPITTTDAKRFLDRLAELADGTRKETACALQAHVLFRTAEGVAEALARAEEANQALIDMEALRNVEAGMSPEPAFRAGGERAAGKYRKTGLDVDPKTGAFRHVSDTNTDYLTSLYVTQDLLSGIVNEQFDPQRLAGQIGRTYGDLTRALSGKGSNLDNYLEFCRRNRVTPILSSDEDAFERYIGALSVGNSAPAGVIDANRRRLGRILGTLSGGLELMRTVNDDRIGGVAAGHEAEAAKARLDALVQKMWPSLLSGDREHPSILSRSIIDAILLGPTVLGESEGGRVVGGEDLLTAIRVTEEGQVGLASKLTVDHVDRLRGAYMTLRASTEEDFTYRRAASAAERRNQAARPVKLTYVIPVTGEDGSVHRVQVEDNVSNADFAFLLQLAVAAGQPFSSVTENDTRADLTCIFTDKELAEQERWGAAAEKTLVGRALCCVGRTAADPYALLKKPPKYPGRAANIAPLLYGAVARTAPRPGFGNALAGARLDRDRTVALVNEMEPTPFKLLLDEVAQGTEIRAEYEALVKSEAEDLQSRRARGIVSADGVRLENRLVSSFDTDIGPDTLRALNSAPMDSRGGFEFMFVGAEELDGEPSLHTTLEDAVNSLAEPGSLSNNPSEDFEKTVTEWVRRRQHGDQSFGELAALVLKRTKEKYGDPVVKWAQQALVRGGDAPIDPATFGAVRTAVEDFAGVSRKPAPAVRPSVSAGTEISGVSQRMTRSGFAQFLRTADDEVRARVITNPFENIRFALEKAFGKSAGPGKTGVKVEQVSTTVNGSKIPTNLIRVTRWYKVKENGGVVVKPAVTYIATGEVLDIQPDSPAYLEGIARAVSGGDSAVEENTLRLLKGMTPAQVAKFARAKGCVVNGESDTALTTNALLALTGLVKLDAGADYKTLFHEYFHQMLAFYRRIGVCTAEDMKELTKRFSVGGVFNEEVAADAFADYVVRRNDGAPAGKLLANGVGDNELFHRFLTTAQAFLAGATAMDQDGAPAFMKMLVTGDFTERSVSKAAAVTAAELKRTENMLLGRETDVPATFDWQSGVRGVAEKETDVVRAYSDFKAGRATEADVIAAIDGYTKASSDSREHPKFEGTVRPFGVDPSLSEDKPVEPKPEKAPKQRRRGKAPGTLAAELMTAALDGAEREALTDEEKEVLESLRKSGVASASSAYDALALAGSLLAHVSTAFGFDAAKARNRERLFELAVRLAHRLLETDPSTARDVRRIEDAVASQTKLAAILRNVPEDMQYDTVLAPVTNVASALEEVADRLARANDEERSGRLSDLVATFRRVCTELARGKDPAAICGSSDLSGVLQYALPGCGFTVTDNGFRADGGDIDKVAGTGALFNAAAHALGTVYAFGRLLRENGRDFPAAGEKPSAGPSPVTPPVSGCLEPEFSPQLLLQSQTSWLASDLQKRFFGVNLRDIMTDTSLQAGTERANAIMRNLEFYFGADVLPGDRARQVSLGTSDLAFGEDGVISANKGARHSTHRYAAVRGYAFGLVNRAAKTAGDAFTLSDVSMINFVLQAAGHLANGESRYITGIDISNDPLPRLRTLFAGRDAKNPLGGGSVSPMSVINRVHGKRRGEAVGSEVPLNFDQLLYKVITALPSAVSGVEFDEKGMPTGKVRNDGVYAKVVDAYAAALGALSGTRRRGNERIDVLVTKALALRDMTVTVRNGRRAGKSYLAIPLGDIERVWTRGNPTFDKLVGAGRNPALLGMRRAAQEVATSAALVNRVAAASKFVRSGLGNVVTGQNLAGLWFDSGSGGHGIAVNTFRNVKDFLEEGVANQDQEFLANKFRAFTMTVKSDAARSWGKRVESAVTRVVGGTVVKGLEQAFAVDDDGQIPNVPFNRMQHLMQLLGLGARASHEEMLDFISAVREGLYAKGSARNPSSVDLRENMTVFELDHAIYELECVELQRARLGEGDSILTRPESEGGYGYSRQDLVDLNEWLRREGLRMMLDRRAEEKVASLVNTVSAETMLREFGELPSSKTGPERVKAMAETLVASERFRGCLSQMLTTVGADGSPNFIVSPGAGADNFADDAYWGALARFVFSKLTILHDNRGFTYDDTLSGKENMTRLAERVRAEVARDRNAEKKPKTRIPWRLIPPDDIQAGNLFSFVLALDDRADEDEDRLDRLVGGEAMGYMKQLFGSVKSPTVWRGLAGLDRIMAYSKAASVGMSAFFAFATRFESPVAACGFLNTAAGYRKGTADLARNIGKALRKTEAGAKVADFFNFEENMPYLADFMEAVTSDDLAVAQMREFMDLVGMPLSDAIRNPMADTGGQIDSDIRRLSDWLVATGYSGLAKEVRGMMNAALHNPGEYAFSNVLNCVKMAVVAQTMHRLRRECERADRPFDPVRELRRFSSYINAEIGGIQPERYAWLTPGMQQVLRLGMFSYQWTMGAWTAGTGGLVTDMIFGGHTTTKDLRRFAFIRWLRMLGIVKVGVPVCLQLVIKGLAKCMSGLFDDPDDPDPLGIEDMPWLCFDNESKIGALSFDITPILRVCGRLRRAAKDDYPATAAGVSFAVPVITGVLGGLFTRSVGGALVSGAFASTAGRLLPDYTGVGHGRNTSGKRRYYMHFGKQSDEFWRWFTDFWTQATNKLSIPTQKTVEAFFGSTNGSNFGKNFKDKPLLDRFFTTSLDPQESAIVNFFTAFLPFSAATVASNPDAGALGMFAPVQMGASLTGQQKRIAQRLAKLASTDAPGDVWAYLGNRREMRLLCSDIMRECRLNGFDPKEVLDSGLGTAMGDLYKALYSALPKTKDDVVDGDRVTRIFRAMRRLNLKKTSLDTALRKKYKLANVDLSDIRNKAVKDAIERLYVETGKNPWLEDLEVEDLIRRTFDENPYRKVRQADKGGDGLSNFLATDEVPETLFGIPVVSSGYTEEDLAFFKENPEAGGFYDLGDGGDEPPPEGPEGPEPTGGDLKGGKYDTAVPKERETEYRAWKTRYAPNDSGEDYDLQGAFMEGLAPDPRTGQWSDKYKKPNHPTFSVESKYATGDDRKYAGSWNGDRFVLTPEATSARETRAFREGNPTLFGHVKSWEKLRLEPYDDIGGRAIGYGAHLDAGGKAVTADTPALTGEEAATDLLARDLLARRNALKNTLPGWSRMSGEARQALLDVSMGKKDILSEKGSPGLWRDLRSAGSDRKKLDAAVKKHYVSYLTDDPKYREGLMNRRIAGMKTFFGEDWSYDNKEWDDERGFVVKGGK